MARAPRRDGYHHGDLRRTLLDAALSLVAQEGLGALSLREVAKRAGVTHAAPYHHFADRGAVMAAIALEGFELLRDAMDAAATAAGNGPSARLAAIGRAYVRFALTHTAHYRVIFRPELAEVGPGPAAPGASPECPPMPPLPTLMGRTAYDVLAEAIADCQEAGLAPAADHDVLVVTAWSLVHGLASLLLDGPLRTPSDPTSALVANRPPAELAELVPNLFAAMFAGTAGTTAHPMDAGPTGRRGSPSTPDRKTRRPRR